MLPLALSGVNLCIRPCAPLCVACREGVEREGAQLVLPKYKHALVLFGGVLVRFAAPRRLIHDACFCV